MASIYEQAQAFRAALIKRDTAAIEYLTNQYSAIYKRLVRDLEAVTSQIAAAQASGEKVSRAWLNRQFRYQSLLSQMDAEFRRYGNEVAFLVRARQVFETQQGRSDASAIVQGRFDRLPVAAIESIVSNLRDSSPLAALLDSFGEQASERVKQTLVEAIARGQNPRAIAGSVRDALGVPLHRALLISRTESVRAYRQSSLQRYSEMGVDKWRWVAAKSPRTCLNCLARDGEIYEVEKPFPAHPACRCTMVPVIESAPVRAETAGQWFERQPDEAKREMMGVKSFEYYQRGAITLNDFKGQYHSAKWGTTTYQRSLKEILEQKRRTGRAVA